jgi:cysteine desulfurase/selenocysteine lyase
MASALTTEKNSGDDDDTISGGIIPSHIDHASAAVISVPPPRQYNDILEQEAIHIEYKYAQGARRFQFWESAPANRLGLGVAVDHVLSMGIDKISHQCSSLGEKLQQMLSTIPGVQVYYSLEARAEILDQVTMVKSNAEDDAEAPYIYPPMQQPQPEQCGIVTFSIQGKYPAEVKRILTNTYGFAISVVPATSTPLDSSRTQVRDLVRASLSYFNTSEEIELFVKAVGEIAAS